MVLRRQKQVAVCEFKAKLVYIIPQLPGGHGEALCKQTNKHLKLTKPLVSVKNSSRCVQNCWQGLVQWTFLGLGLQLKGMCSVWKRKSLKVCDLGIDMTLPCWLMPWHGEGNSARRNNNQEVGPWGFCHYLERRLVPTITVRQVSIRMTEQPGTHLWIGLHTHPS